MAIPRVGWAFSPSLWGSLRRSSLHRPWSSSRNLTNLLRCIRGRVTLLLVDVDARWRPLHMGAWSLMVVRPCRTCEGNGYPMSGISLFIKSLESLRPSSRRRPCSSLRNLTNLLRCIRGWMTLPMAYCWCKIDGHWIWRHEARWLSKKTTNSWQRTSLPWCIAWRCGDTTWGRTKQRST